MAKPLKTEDVEKYIGKKFGNRTIIKTAGKNKYGNVLVLCKCECGELKTVTLCDLIHGRKTSCMHCSKKKYKNIIGKKFGKWTVLEENQTTLNGDIAVKCICECGKTAIHAVSHLMRGGTTCCTDCYKKKQKEKSQDITNTYIGKKYGKLTIKNFLYSKRKASGYRKYFECECECGKTCIACLEDLKAGKKSYCKECGIQARTKHGLCKSRLYGIWCGMKRRCNTPTEESYKDYGGRGITVCKEWEEDFQNFSKWAISNGYRDDLTIDRKDSDGNYCPENCCWATYKEQNNHLRISVRNHSGYRGVSWSRSAKKWLVQIVEDKQILYSGYFLTQKEAVEAYNNNIGLRKLKRPQQEYTGEKVIMTKEQEDLVNSIKCNTTKQEENK